MAHPESNWTCATCSRTAHGHYCGNCGEAKPDHVYSFHHVIEHAFETFFHLDAKIPRTLSALFRTPGELTRSYFAGRRKPYVSPFLVIFWASFLFYLAQSATGLVLFSPPLRAYVGASETARSLVERRIVVKHLGLPEFAEHFNHTSSVASKSLVILMALLFSLVVWILFATRGRFFVEHLVFALHTYSFWIFWLCAMLGAAYILTIFAPGLASKPGADQTLVAFEFGGLALYLFLSLRRFYGDGRTAAALRSASLTVAAFGIMYAYRWFLFMLGVYLS